jgi:hypothetical protein
MLTVRATNMDAVAVRALIDHELANFRYEPLAPGTTYGEPWSEERVRGYIPRLQAALVPPYKMTFRLGDTNDESRAEPPRYAEYWVVAVSTGYIEFYDPAKGEFGLADTFHSDHPPVTIGVRGDLLGVYCAI